MATVTDPIMLDSTGQAIKNSIDLLNANINRTASNIPYDNNLTIKGKIDEIDAKTASDIPYSSGVSVKDKIDEKVSKTGDTIEGNLDIDRKNGTAGTEGNTFLNLGNNIPKSSAGNSTGNLRVYGDTGYGVVLNTVNNMTGNQYVSLPNKSGTMALMSDLINKVNIQGTLAGNVLTVLAGLPQNSISYYAQSNNPTNQPSGCQWGSYIIFKGSQYSTLVYVDNSHIAHAYAVSDTATSISWHII